MTYDKTMRFKGEKCSGGKMSKDRITVMVAANMSGSEKRKLLVIGKSKNPRCFKNVKNLPVVYEHNKKSWMTSDLFIKFLHDWDKELQKSSRRILLVVDNCPAHPRVEDLKSIELGFLPPNCTSVLQPMDQGVINSLKTHYRKMQLLETIKNIELEKETAISLLDAVLMVSAAWEKVTAKTIQGCFRHAGFTSTNEMTDENDSDEEDNIPLAQLKQRCIDTILSDNELLELINVDTELETCEDLNEADIVKNIENNSEPEYENNDEDDNFLCSVPSCAEALHAVSILKKFVTYEGLNDQRLLNSISMIDQRLERVYYENYRFKKQSKITHFFKPTTV
ncbi:tigger transposable element-derived protein 4-like [Coccinella septempunctata]|uniref:tigger transposable element-derived protein 4-like n=1 Tax=Coccinella septempunctata TaxID=41139 RepID=UPI001D0872BF|nr:tigger transposable element-derived protein 4-like [Coccinella septempunctata]